jgi:hypothetical protein
MTVPECPVEEVSEEAAIATRTGVRSRFIFPNDNVKQMKPWVLDWNNGTSVLSQEAAIELKHVEQQHNDAAEHELTLGASMPSLVTDSGLENMLAEWH